MPHSLYQSDPTVLREDHPKVVPFFLGARSKLVLLPQRAGLGAGLIGPDTGTQVRWRVTTSHYAKGGGAGIVANATFVPRRIRLLTDAGQRGG
jgi:hypothetical protein